MMHNFLGVDGDNRPDVSILRDASARSRARDNVRMIADYRGDVGALRSAASLGGAAVDVLGHPQRAVERMREAILRSEEHTSELQSLMRNSYAVFCLKKKKKKKMNTN